MKKPRFSLKTLLFVVTLAAVLLGWWADRGSWIAENQRLVDQNDILRLDNWRNDKLIRSRSVEVLETVVE